MGKFTTHVLDTAAGHPAAGVDIRLYAMGDGRALCATAMTNSDGRTESALLEGGDFTSGTYELEFDIGPYFAGQGQATAQPPFLDTVVIRVSVNADEDYHVPLLASPWSYATYRGS